jgi:YggT family protein
VGSSSGIDLRGPGEEEKSDSLRRTRPSGCVFQFNPWQSGRVEAVWLVVWYVLFAFWLLLTARVVIELVRAFAREWRPAGGVAVTLETIYTVTDPPVRLVRKIIPMVRIGGVGLDLSIMVLLLVVFIAMQLAMPG